MKVKKRTIFLFLSVLLLIVISVSGIFASLNTKTKILDNELGFGIGKVEIKENFNGWDLKEVSLTNTSDNMPGVIRAMLVPRVEDENGDYVISDLAPLTAPEGNLVKMGDFVFELANDWSDNWFYKDGFFYCKTVLEVGETSPLLLKKASLANDSIELKEKYEDAEIKVDIIAHILQADGEATDTEWGVTVKNNVVSPITGGG